MVAVQTALVLGILTAVGVGFAAFGYDLAGKLVSWVGVFLGIAAGGGVGWFAAPVAGVSPEGLTARVGVTAGAALVGAILGRVLFPVATRLAALVAGFLAPAVATLIVFVGSDVTQTLATIDPTNPAAFSAALEELAAASAFEGGTFTTTLLIAGAAGLAGAIVAVRFHTQLIALAVTGLGAVFLGIVTPLWQQALGGGVQFGGGPSQASTIAIGAAFVLGVAVQAVRHLDVGSSRNSGRSLEP